MAADVTLEYLRSVLGGLIDNNVAGVTPEGGLFSTYINATGAPSVKGTIVSFSMTTNRGVMTALANSETAMGVIYESGIPDGSFVKVVTNGRAEVLIKNLQAPRLGYWCGVSDVAGKMFQTVTPSTAVHWRQIGYCTESKLAGIDVLATVQLHFN